MEEKEAISRVKQGDLTGLEELVNRYQVKAVYSAFLIVQDHMLAEEVAQNAFVKVAEKANLFDSARPFAPWFFRIVVNDAIKSARQEKHLKRLEEEPDDETKGLAKWLISPDPLPEQQVELKERQGRLRQAMKALSPEQRAVVVMRYYLQMPEEEMSVRLEKPLTTVKWWLRAARKRLKSLLQANETEENSIWRQK